MIDLNLFGWIRDMSFLGQALLFFCFGLVIVVIGLSVRYSIMWLFGINTIIEKLDTLNHQLKEHRQIIQDRFPEDMGEQLDALHYEMDLVEQHTQVIANTSERLVKLLS